MALNHDFRDLFAALNAAKARYLLIGGYAVAFHGRPRYTKDLDVWVDASPDNAARVWTALTDFGAPLSNVGPGDFETPGMVFMMGLPPNRIDVLTGIAGVEFSEAWLARSEMTYGDQLVHVIGKAELIRNKRAAGRPHDLLDADWLQADSGRSDSSDG